MASYYINCSVGKSGVISHSILSSAGKTTMKYISKPQCTTCQEAIGDCTCSKKSDNATSSDAVDTQIEETCTMTACNQCKINNKTDCDLKARCNNCEVAGKEVKCEKTCDQCRDKSVEGCNGHVPCNNCPRKGT